MGIPSYFRYLVSEFDQLVVSKTRTPVSRLFLDLNCAIHPCVRKVMNDYKSIQHQEYERKACHSVLEYINYLVKVSEPQKLLYIAIDGVAPRAKMVQQRQRRFKSVREYQETESLKKTHLEDYQASERWDTNAITPGTAFMDILTKYLQHELPKQSYPEGLKIILSDSNVAGEGEHKILQYLKTNPLLESDTSSDAIYGLDADLIMLALSSGQDNIYLLRETVEYGNTIKKNSEDLPVMLYLDIHTLKNVLYQEMERKGLTKSTPDAIVKDYILMCFMLGNDFLPHPPSISIRHGGVELLETLYTEIHQELGYDMVYNTTPNNYQIRTEFILRMWEILALREENLILTHEKKAMKPHYITNREYENSYERELDKLKFYPVFHREMEYNIDVGSPGWRKRYYQECFGVSGEEEIKELVYQYCYMLSWTLKYYLEECPDWTRYYPYRHMPLFQDLAKYAPPTFPDPVVSGSQPVSPYQQLLLVLPQNSFSLLPVNYQKYLRQSALNDLTPFYPTNYRLDTLHKTQSWECSPILPRFDIEHLTTICKKGLTRDEKERIKTSGSIVLS